MKKNKLLFTLMTLAAILLIGSIFYLSRNHFEDEYRYTPPENNSTTNMQNTENETSIETELTSNTEEENLQYIIEEEKLAYDVYTIFYNEYGARVFGNILKSESTHQDRVLEVMQTNDVEDPRIVEPGKFSDQSLQDLYDDLIKRGLSNEREAYLVGIAIEEKDIADLNTMIDQSEDELVIQMLQDLKSGSEKHLAAFNRQI